MKTQTTEYVETRLSKRAGIRRRGSVAVVTAIVILTLVGFVALAVDLGYLHNVKQETQRAADAAAHAAASWMFTVNADLDSPIATAMAIHCAAENMNTTLARAGSLMSLRFGRIDNPFDPDSPFVATLDESTNAVEVTLYRTMARGAPVPLFFASVFGRTHADVTAKAIAGQKPLSALYGIPVALRAPGFGPVDPEVEEANPGKVGPSEPANGIAFQIGEEVIVFTAGNGRRQPVHLVLDVPEFQGVAETDAIIAGLDGAPLVILEVGSQLPTWNRGTGNGNFGIRLEDRFTDGDPDNDIVVLPIVATLPGSRNADGELTGDIEVVDFVAVHLDRVETINVGDPDHPGRDLTVNNIVGHVVRYHTAGRIETSSAGFANSVFGVTSLR